MRRGSGDIGSYMANIRRIFQRLLKSCVIGRG